MEILRLESYLCGQWQAGDDEGRPLINPVSGEQLARASSSGLNLQSGLDYARKVGGAALQKLTYAQRAALLANIADVLSARIEDYHRIAFENCGNTPGDAAIDVEGGIATLKYFSAIGKALGEYQYLAEPGLDRLGRDPNYQCIHIHTPLKGVAIHINAFNFPSWGLWEKAAVALLSGVPVFAKPATATALLTYQMIKDVVNADILPEGSLSLISGDAYDLMDYVQSGDTVFFTGSAQTAVALRSNPNVISSGVRFNVEADSVNMAMLGEDVAADTPLFEAFVKEVAREMTVKAGQKCTAIRRVIVPRHVSQAVVDALKARLAKTIVGNPAVEGVRMGPLINKSQQQAALEGLALLSQDAEVVFGAGADFTPVGDDVESGCFVQPTLLYSDTPIAAQHIHSVEVFGPVATVMPYDNAEEAMALAAMGGGSLAGSVFTADDNFSSRASLSLASCHGRLLVVDEAIMSSHSGHGIAMPQCVHGGPGRAGGGEEMGGLRALRAYHQRSAVQGNVSHLTRLLESGAKYAIS